MRSEIEQAVELLQSGEPEAMEKALALLQDTVFSFSMRVCQQREDAEDTMQEVLVKSVPYLSRFESPKALIVWLYKVAKNRCLMSRRKSKFAPKQELSLEALTFRKNKDPFQRNGCTQPALGGVRSATVGKSLRAVGEGACGQAELGLARIQKAVIENDLNIGPR